MSLTERQLEVLAGVLSDWPDRSIAGALLISINTVKSHKKAIYEYLGVRSRRELMPLIHMAHGFVMPEKKAKGAGA